MAPNVRLRNALDARPAVRRPTTSGRALGPPRVPGWRLGAARGLAERARGLLGRRSIAPDEGLWLPVRSVHTFGMRVTLDLVWLDAGGDVVRMDPAVPSGRVRSCAAARGGVIETAAGRGGVLAGALRGRRDRVPGRTQASS